MTFFGYPSDPHLAYLIAISWLPEIDNLLIERACWRYHPHLDFVSFVFFYESFGCHRIMSHCCLIIKLGLVSARAFLYFLLWWHRDFHAYIINHSEVVAVSKLCCFLQALREVHQPSHLQLHKEITLLNVTAPFAPWWVVLTGDLNINSYHHYSTITSYDSM